MRWSVVTHECAALMEEVTDISDGEGVDRIVVPFKPII